LKAAHVGRLDFLHARKAIKITHWSKDTAVGKTSCETTYAVISLTSGDASTQDLARLVREHWSIETHHHVRDVTFAEDTAASRTGSGSANLVAIRTAIKDVGYLHIPEGRRDHTTPAEPCVSTASTKTDADIQGTRRGRGTVTWHGYPR
jgi:predicted transposase YbfD/YdcC